MSLNKILLVDDDKALNFLNRMALRDSNLHCAIDEANDGQQALDYISSHSDCPDVILLDLNMPGVDGITFLKEYEDMNKCCEHSRIFVLSSSNRDEDRAQALSSRYVSGYFDKPLTSSHIEKMVALVG